MEIFPSNGRIKDMLHCRFNMLKIALAAAFFMANALKITLFNMYMTDSSASKDFLYKFGLNILLSFGLYIILLGTRSRLPFTLFYILQALYIFANLAYYLYFHSYLHISQSISLFSEGMGAAGHLAIPASRKLLTAIMDLPAFGCLLAAKRGSRTFSFKRHWVVKIGITMLCAMSFAFILVNHNLHQYAIFATMKTDSSKSESQVVQRYGTIANNLADIILNSNESNLVSRFKYGQHLSSAGDSSITKPNFVVIQVESMDANAVNKQHNGKYVMPFLHSLSKQSIYYPYTMSYHEAGETSDSEFSTINSVEPLDSFPSIKLQDYNYPNSLVKQLDKGGYDTIAFHGNIGTFFNRDVAYPKMGYREFTDMKKMGLKDVGWGAPDSDVFKYAEAQLVKEKQPFFAYTITMTSHGPFTNAGNYYNNSNYADIKDTPARDYMNSMSYVDSSVKDYVNYIRANFKNTYIFIWGDHTPCITNSDYRQASFTAGDKYYEFVPLIILTPDNIVYKENKTAASFLDVAPTILNASGIPYSIDSDGTDLINRSGTEPKIPFKGSMADRNYLYSTVSKVK